MKTDSVVKIPPIIHIFIWEYTILYQYKNHSKIMHRKMTDSIVILRENHQN